jgi:hypothetical protein
MQSAKCKVQNEAWTVLVYTIDAACLSILHFAFCILHFASFFVADVSAQDTTQPNAPPPGVRRALILCGLPGDAEHRQLYSDSLALLCAGLERQGFAADNLHILWGEEPTDQDPAAVRASRGIAGRETIEQAAQSLREALKPEDTLWIFVMGHGHFDGRHSWLNVAGPDINQVEFGRLFEKLPCREQVFFITTAASGFYLKPLAAAGRVVITATEPDLEVNETLFPHKLAAALGSLPADSEWDVDKDGQFSLLDLYLGTARQVAEEYAGSELLATEHSLLDDNGDGRGSELQIDFLPENLGGRLRAGQNPPARPKSDGLLASRILLAREPSGLSTDPKTEEKPQ